MLRECTFRPQLNDERNKRTKSKIKQMILARKSSEGRPPLHLQMTPTHRTTNREQEEEEDIHEENVDDSQAMINVES
jgi:hypothetical protein